METLHDTSADRSGPPSLSPADVVTGRLVRAIYAMNIASLLLGPVAPLLAAFFLFKQRNGADINGARAHFRRQVRSLAVSFLLVITAFGLYLLADPLASLAGNRRDVVHWSAGICLFAGWAWLVLSSAAGLVQTLRPAAVTSASVARCVGTKT